MKTLIASFLAAATLVPGVADAQQTPRKSNIQYWSSKDDPGPNTGVWRCVITTPGGDLPFTMYVDYLGKADRNSTEPGEYRVQFQNGNHVFDVDGFETSRKPDEGNGEFVLPFPHYGTRIEGSFTASQNFLRGEFYRERKGGDLRVLPFRAQLSDTRRFEPLEDYDPDAPHPELAETFAVSFDDSDSPAVAHLRVMPDGTNVTGTIRTTTGDYGHLAGSYEHGVLRLSTFDGMHAFLFNAYANEDGSFEGEFYSGDHYNTGFVMTPDADAALPDAFSLTSWNDAVNIGSLQFTDLDGNPVTLEDVVGDAPAALIEVFGSWCPNCGDAADFLAEMHETYSDRGLKIVGLAFEMTGDPERDAPRVRRHIAKHATPYDVLLAGEVGKEKATEALNGALDQVRSYPTTIFLGPDATIRAVHQGFEGPATGEAHTRLRESFIERIESMLEEAGR